MTRDEVITQLSQYVVLHTQWPCLCVMLPSYSEVKEFRKDFTSKINEIPKWLMPEVKRDLIVEFGWCYGKILFVHNPRHLQGRSITSLYRSKRCMDGSKKDYEHHNLIAILTQTTITEFDD